MFMPRVICRVDNGIFKNKFHKHESFPCKDNIYPDQFLFCVFFVPVPRGSDSREILIFTPSYKKRIKTNTRTEPLKQREITQKYNVISHHLSNITNHKFHTLIIIYCHSNLETIEIFLYLTKAHHSWALHICNFQPFIGNAGISNYQCLKDSYARWQITSKIIHLSKIERII